MKKLLAALLVMTIFTLAFAGNGQFQAKFNVEPNENSQNRQNRNVIWEDGFEDGMGEWTSVDGTAPVDWIEWWHLTETFAYEGESWWMGDEDLGGYSSHRYLVLDTPEISLPSDNPTLSFKVNWLTETPGGEPEDYDGWDGCNVRLSDDGGETWQVISGAPEYNCTSLYSFGYEFNEGPGIAGWADTSDGWQDAEFDLSSWAGEDVMIRFAFASDPAYDTNDQPDMIGMLVDNIDVAGVFQSDGEGAAGDDQMMPGYGGEASGDFWEMDTTNPYEGENCMHCPVQPSLIDELISPEIELPDSDILKFSYWTYYDIPDSDGDGDNSLEDYYLVFAKSVDEDTWTQLHYNYTGLQDLPTEWREINQEFADTFFGWQNGTCMLSDWAGQTIQLKFVLQTDGNDDGGVGDGFFLDNVNVISDVYLPPVEGLIAETVDNTVELEWEEPSVGGEEGWIHWDSGDNNDGIGLTDGGTFLAASRWTPGDLMPYSGGSITSVKFFPITTMNASYTIKIWSGSNAANEIYSQEVTDYTVDQWNDITLDSPVELDVSQELWFGYETTHEPGDFVAGTDAGPAVAGYGDKISSDGGATWSNLSDFDLDYNWNLQAYITAGERELALTERDRDLLGYKVYHKDMEDGEFAEIAQVDGAGQTSYTHETPTEGSMNYYVVTGLYDAGESEASNQAQAYVLPASSQELYYDDGSAEEGFNAGSGNSSAVKFTPEIVDEIVLTQAKIYIEEVGTMNLIVRVWEDDGDDGMPGDQPIYTTQVAVADQVVGWNYVEFDDLPFFHFTEGSFYVGVTEAGGSPAIGLDTNSEVMGNSYVNEGEWTALTDGDLMIRTIIDGDTSTDEEEVELIKLSSSNYPNPFNPKTTIKYNIPEKSHVEITVHNIKGQKIKTLVNEIKNAGMNTVTWKGKDDIGNVVSSGVYFYRVKTENKTVNKKMLLLK